MRDKVPNPSRRARRPAQPSGIKTRFCLRILAAALLSASMAHAADGDTSNDSVQSEEIMVSEHPPRLVYFRHATSSPSRIARKAIRAFCLERPSRQDTATADPDKGPAVARFCGGAEPIILMGLDFRDEFNRTLYACRGEMDLHYVAYPLYWRDVFEDRHWCARVEYDGESRRYRVAE